MKFALFVACLFSVACASTSNSVVAGDRTITRVVKLLQGMLDKSKADGEEERDLYGKYKCYCDTNEESKKASIKSLGEQIGLLSNDIDGLQASTGVLSSEVAKLQADMAANVEARNKAEKVRNDNNAAFHAMESDSEQAIQQMVDAIDVLSAVGADQTLAESAADHNQFISGHKSKSLVKLRAAVKQALLAASSVTTAKQTRVLESFLQTPGAGFTGTYTAQAGEVVGILKDMRDTFESNLAAARATEKAEADAHSKLMATMEAAHTEMSDSYEAKQDNLGSNDADLATKKDQLSNAEATKADDESFLASLLEMCTAKTKDYDERVLLRRNEEAAIAEAIAILNSDAAFETFGKVDATKTGATSFLQRRDVHKHVQRAGSQRNDEAGTMHTVEGVLAKAVAVHPSLALSKVFASLEAGNPFTIVLAEIKKMVGLIAKEETVDQEQLSWCNSERATNNANLDAKKQQIIDLNSEIDELTDVIENPTTGLKFQIQETEAALEQNRQSQAENTADRKESNAAYQKDTSNLVEAERLVASAVAVLKKYYSKILKAESSALVQTDPEPPATWDNDSYKGQSGQGKDAISMLEFILEETKKEEATAHKDEADAQKQFEAIMADLTTQEKNKEGSLANLRQLVAEKDQALLERKADLKATEEEKASIEAYLVKIKPGCDFITTHIDERTNNRKQEADALNNAAELLKGTPAYQTAIAEAHNETLGGCLDKCTGNEDHLRCKACLAKVTEPAYCAGHPGTEGC